MSHSPGGNDGSAGPEERQTALLTRTPSQVRRTLARFDSYPFDSHGHSKFDSWGEKFKVYAAFEVGIWLPGLFALCYCYQPSMRFVRTRVGGVVVQSIGAWLRRYVPSQYEKIAALSQRAYGSPKGLIHTRPQHPASLHPSILDAVNPNGPHLGSPRLSHHQD